MYIEKFYRGFYYQEGLKDKGEQLHGLLWLSSDPDYASQYGDSLMEYDVNTDVRGLVDCLDIGEINYYEGPSGPDLERLKRRGIKGYFFDAENGVETLVLWSRSPIVSKRLIKSPKENVNEGTGNFEKWYRGYNAKYGSDHTFVLWLTNDIDYARSYGNRVEEVVLDMDKIKDASAWDMDDYCEDYEYDVWDGPDEEAAQRALADGYNCNYFEANEDCSYCMCLWSKEPIVSRRELSREEFEAIEGYEGFDNPTYDTELNEEKEEEVTYYRFLSEVKSFLAKLMSRPIDAKPSKYLRDRGIGKEKLIRDLRNKGVLERHEKILDSTNSDKKKATYTVKYKVRKKNFEDRIHWLYAKYFEKNVNESVDELRAYHGSMNSFDEFDENHVGEGAGAQLNGWGTYVTTDRATGEHYCERFLRDTNQTYLYEVEIPEDNGRNYLNLNGNDPKVYDWIYKVLARAYPKCKWYIKYRIKSCKEKDSLDQILYSMPGLSAEEISKTLDRNGVVGIRYVNNEGGFNYCVFRASNVKIVNRSQYGMNESVFENEEEMKEAILNGPDGDTYRERGGIVMNEDAGGGAGGGAGASGGDGGGVFGGDIAGATTEDGSNGQYTAIAFPMMRRQLGTRRKKKEENESVKRRNLIITEEQFRRIIEATATSPAVGGGDGENDYTYTVPFTGVDKDDPTISPEGRKGGFSMKRIPNTDPPVKESKENKRLRKNDKGETVPEKCERCGGDVVVKISGEPVFVCPKCGKYYGVVPFNGDVRDVDTQYHGLVKARKEKIDKEIAEECKNGKKPDAHRLNRLMEAQITPDIFGYEYSAYQRFRTPW